MKMAAGFHNLRPSLVPAVHSANGLWASTIIQSRFLSFYAMRKP
jgi:hypothetical protein